MYGHVYVWFLFCFGVFFSSFPLLYNISLDKLEQLLKTFCSHMYIRNLPKAGSNLRNQMYLKRSSTNV